jgi:hypothetical protein
MPKIERMPTLRLGDVVPGAELTHWPTGGDWVELDTDEHGAAALIVWRMDGAQRSPKCEALAALLVSAAELLALCEELLPYAEHESQDTPAMHALIARAKGGA